MNKKKSLIFFLVYILLVNCSFDTKTGIWTGDQVVKKKAAEKEKEKIRKQNRKKIYSVDYSYSFEKTLVKKINLSKPIKNLDWKMPGLNEQNFLGNIYLSGINNKFLKKKIVKNRFFSLSKKKSSPLIYKNLTFSIYKNNIYVADNVGFIYAIGLDSGKLLWIKNHGVPFKSKIKVFDDKIFLMNQDNKIISFDVKDGSVIWNIPSVSSFIKSQNFLSLAVSKKGDIVAITTLGDLLKINSKNGKIEWSLNTLGSVLTDVTDFFKSSDIVIIDDSIFFSVQSSFFSCDLNSGYVRWRLNVSSVSAPIINDGNIFVVTENGYFVIINKDSAEIISSTNILKILKKKKQLTKVTGFIMGSGKIYSVTSNGYLITSSAVSGKVVNFKKIGDPITSSPVINDGKLFVYTENSRILGFN